MSIFSNGGVSDDLLGMIDNSVNKLAGMGGINGSDLAMANAVVNRKANVNALNAQIDQNKEAIRQTQGILPSITDPNDLALANQVMGDYQNKIAQQRMEKGKQYLGGAKDAGLEYWRWMNNGDLKDRAIKYGGTAAAWMGVNAVGRGLTGGGVTYNKDGNRDIMGLPFV